MILGTKLRLRKKLRNMRNRIVRNVRHRHVATMRVRALRNRMILSHVTSVGSPPRSRHRVYIHVYFLSRRPVRR